MGLGGAGACALLVGAFLAPFLAAQSPARGLAAWFGVLRSQGLFRPAGSLAVLDLLAAGAQGLTLPASGDVAAGAGAGSIVAL
jgi:hypothetical protein